MTREDIIRMAIKVGGIDKPELDSPGVCFLERFAALVAADERERCAEVCDMIAANSVNPTASECAYAIRNRK